MCMEKWSFALLAGFAALFLAGCVSSAPPDSVVGNINPAGVATWWGSWEWLAVAGLLISTFIVAIVYMLGSFMRNPGVIAWCKVELYQIAMTAVIVAGLVGLVWTVASIDTSVIGINCYVPLNPLSGQPEVDATLQPGCNMFDFSMVYLKWLRQQTWVIYQRHLLIYQKYAFQTSISYGAAMGGIGPVLQPMVWLQPVLNFTTVILNFIAPAMVLIMVLIEIMRYIQFGMLNIILPIGVVCRCFGPLRDFGGALMGMSIALFLFYPFMFTLNAAMIMPSGEAGTQYYLDEIAFENQMNEVSTQMDEENLEDIGILMKKGIVDEDGNLLEPEAGMRQWVSGTWYQISVMMDGASLGQQNFNVSHVILGALVLPILNFVIIITAARELSGFLGQEVDVTNLTRMI